MSGTPVILRLPNLAIGSFDRKRLILKQAGQGVLAGLFQGSKIDRRLDQRPNWPRCIQRPVEAGKAWMTTAQHGLQLASFRVGDQHRAFYAFGCFAQTLQRIGHGLFSLGLDDRVKAGENPQPFLSEVFVAVVLSQLPLHQIEKRRVGAVGQTATLRHAERRLPRLSSFLGTDHLLLSQQIDD